MSEPQFPVDPHRSKLQLKMSGRWLVPDGERAKLENIFYRMMSVASWPLKHACCYVMAFELEVDTTVGAQ